MAVDVAPRVWLAVEVARMAAGLILHAEPAFARGGSSTLGGSDARGQHGGGPREEFTTSDAIAAAARDKVVKERPLTLHRMARSVAYIVQTIISFYKEERAAQERIDVRKVTMVNAAKGKLSLLSYLQG